MKTNRSIPFGYTMTRGKIGINKTEMPVVHHICRLYQEGNSLETIAESIKPMGIPYSTGDSQWNKHKVRRILTDIRYTGEKGYLPVIEKEQFQSLQELRIIRRNGDTALTDNPKRHIWKRLKCEECGGEVRRIGGRTNERILFRCNQCGATIEFDKNQFEEMLLNKLREILSEESRSKSDMKYVPNQEIIRMENEIDRSIEKMADSHDIRQLILSAAAQRYARCPHPYIEHAESKVDWKIFKEKVAAVLMGTEEIQLELI